MARKKIEEEINEEEVLTVAYMPEVTGQEAPTVRGLGEAERNDEDIGIEDDDVPLNGEDAVAISLYELQRYDRKLKTHVDKRIEEAIHDTLGGSY